MSKLTAILSSDCLGALLFLLVFGPVGNALIGCGG